MNVVLFADHEIGYEITDFVLNNLHPHLLKIKAVFTTNNNGRMWWKGLEDLCSEHSIPFFRYEDSKEKVHAFSEVNYFFLLSWKYLMSSEEVGVPKNGVINLHYSLLPEYRGVYPVNWAIIEGKQKTGVTYHLIDHNIDCGTIICAREEVIHPWDTSRTLQKRLDSVALNLFPQMLEHLNCAKFSNKITESRSSSGNYYSRRRFEKIGEINLSGLYKAETLINLLRGMSFLETTPTCFFIDSESGEKIYLHLNLSSSKEAE